MTPTLTIIRCERCRRTADVTRLVARMVEAGRRPKGWRPKRCPGCVLELIEGFDTRALAETEERRV